MRCPCRKASDATTYEDCCGRHHSGKAQAPTAEALMRSRYSAFAMRNTPYLLATWHPTRRPKDFALDDGLEWYMLKILHSTEDGDDAVVEFNARSRLRGHTHVLHERSRFRRENGRWYYLNGEFPDDSGKLPP
jgi:SEC-C motif domain protein